jgi:cation:H+ antiporter
MAAWLLIGAGLVGLVIGAEALVRGAVRIASWAKISPLVVGLTIVAFGTSAPELVVSVDAALTDRADIALGNVIGSNIFNVLVILGLSGLVAPLVVASRIVRIDAPIMVGASLLAWGMCAAGGGVSRIEGAALLAGLLVFVGLQIVLGRREGARAAAASPEAPPPAGGRSALVGLAMIAVGLVLLAIGARWLVDGATQIARALGASELVIGLTIVAAGTSLPEVGASVVAALRGQRDIAVGNVVGSNIFNLLGILGGAAVIGDGVAAPVGAIATDLPVMVACAVACLPVFFTGLAVARWEASLFLVLYAVYVGWLLLHAAAHPAQEEFAFVALWVIAPLATAAVLAPTIFAWRHRRRAAR